MLTSHKKLFSAKYYDRSLDVLETALNEISFYRSWQIFDPGREHPIDARYAAMPILTKRDIREHSVQDFLPSNRDVKRGLDDGEIELVKTSGTTSESVTNIWNQEWWDASERASWKLNSYATEVASGNHREAILTSSLNVGFVSDDSPLSMEKRLLILNEKSNCSRLLYLNEKSSSMLWTSKFMDRMIMELESFKPAILEANPSYLAKLCRYITSCAKSVSQPELIVFTYEYPTILHFRQIQRVFNAPMMSSYGTTEVGSVFVECEKGKFHQNSEFCRVDFQPFKPEHGGPTLGRILVTTFNNPWYYMVRFNVGDLAHIDEEESCSCGRESGLILSAIEGRAKNVTLTCKGRAVTLCELDNALSILEGVDEYQLFQITDDAYRLHVVSQRTDKGELKEEAKKILKKLYGAEAKISIVFETTIAPGISGKYCLAQKISPIEIESLLDERYVVRK